MVNDLSENTRKVFWLLESSALPEINRLAIQIQRFILADAHFFVIIQLHCDLRFHDIDRIADQCDGQRVLGVC